MLRPKEIHKELLSWCLPREQEIAQARASQAQKLGNSELAGRTNEKNDIRELMDWNTPAWEFNLLQ